MAPPLALRASVPTGTCAHCGVQQSFHRTSAAGGWPASRRTADGSGGSGCAQRAAPARGSQQDQQQQQERQGATGDGTELIAPRGGSRGSPNAGGGGRGSGVSRSSRDGGALASASLAQTAPAPPAWKGGYVDLFSDDLPWTYDEGDGQPPPESRQGSRRAASSSSSSSPLRGAAAAANSLGPPAPPIVVTRLPDHLRKGPLSNGLLLVDKPPEWGTLETLKLLKSTLKVRITVLRMHMHTRNARG